MCLIFLKKDLIVKIKGYYCKYDLMQGPFYNLIWIGRENIAFVEGLFVKFSVIHGRKFYFLVWIWGEFAMEKTKVH